jgi:hypothetical protein
MNKYISKHVIPFIRQKIELVVSRRSPFSNFSYPSLKMRSLVHRDTVRSRGVRLALVLVLINANTTPLVRRLERIKYPIRKECKRSLFFRNANCLAQISLLLDM